MLARGHGIVVFLEQFGTLHLLAGDETGITRIRHVDAAIFFIFSGQVVWSVAAVMAVGALIGGSVGGRLAGRVKPSILRGIVVTIGVIIALIYLYRLFG